MKRRHFLCVPALACQQQAVLELEAPHTRQLLALGQKFHEVSSAEVTWGRAELTRIAELVLQARARARESTLVALNQVVFETLGFVREVQEPDLKFVFLPSVLRERRGGCVGLGSLYLALGELLGLRVEGILRPLHFHVRVQEGGTTYNAELLREGERMPESWYVARFPIPAGGGAEYGRALSRNEVRGIIEYNVGNERRRAERLAPARRAFELAASHFPAFADAHASLGSTLHLLGDLAGARAAYEAAARINPRLPGLAKNLELLRSEPLPPP